MCTTFPGVPLGEKSNTKALTDRSLIVNRVHDEVPGLHACQKPSVAWQDSVNG